MSTPARPRARVLVYVLLAASVVLLLPYWPWLFLSVWFALGARRFMAPVARAMGGRHRAAAALTVALMLVLLAPVVLVVLPLGMDAVSLVREVLRSDGGRAVLESLVAPPGEHGQPNEMSSIIGMATTHGDRAMAILSRVATAATRALLGTLVLVVGTYEALAEGDKAWAWLEENAPIQPDHLRRLGGAFAETGRGLFIGIGATGLVQASIATVAYLALGVPRALTLGFLTLLVSIIPSIGTALVWVPVALGLALSGRTPAAVGLAAIGLFVVGTVDNVIRPLLTRWGRLQLPVFVVLVSMLSGFAMIGAWGLLIGPLVVRLAKEALAIAKEEPEDVSAPR